MGTGNGACSAADLRRVSSEALVEFEGVKVRIRRIGTAEMLEIKGGLDISAYLGVQKQAKPQTAEEVEAHGEFLRQLVLRGVVEPKVIDARDGEQVPDDVVAIGAMADERIGALAWRVLSFSAHSAVEAQKLRPL